MKRYLVAAGVGTLVFGGVLGSASALDITDPGVAQYGQAMDLACDENGVTVDGYFVESGSSAPSTSHGVVVSGISEDCNGKALVASVTDESGDGLARGFVTINDTKMRVPYNLEGGPVELSDLDGVRLTIG